MGRKKSRIDISIIDVVVTGTQSRESNGERKTVDDDGFDEIFWLHKHFCLSPVNGTSALECS